MSGTNILRSAQWNFESSICQTLFQLGSLLRLIKYGKVDWWKLSKSSLQILCTPARGGLWGLWCCSVLCAIFRWIKSNLIAVLRWNQTLRCTMFVLLNLPSWADAVLRYSEPPSIHPPPPPPSEPAVNVRKLLWINSRIEFPDSTRMHYIWRNFKRFKSLNSYVSDKDFPTIVNLSAAGRELVSSTDRRFLFLVRWPTDKSMFRFLFIMIWSGTPWNCNSVKNKATECMRSVSKTAVSQVSCDIGAILKITTTCRQVRPG